MERWMSKNRLDPNLDYFLNTKSVFEIQIRPLQAPKFRPAYWSKTSVKNGRIPSPWTRVGQVEKSFNYGE